MRNERFTVCTLYHLSDQCTVKKFERSNRRENIMVWLVVVAAAVCLRVCVHVIKIAEMMYMRLHKIHTATALPPNALYRVVVKVES